MNSEHHGTIPINNGVFVDQSSTLSWRDANRTWFDPDVFQNHGTFIETAVLSLRNDGKGRRQMVTIDFFQRLHAHATARPDAIAVQSIGEDGRTARTYGQLLAEIKSVSWSLRESGLVTGDHIAILLPDTIDWVVVFIGAYHAGLVVVPLDPAQDAATLAATVRHAECKLVVTAPAFIAKTRQIATLIDPIACRFSDPSALSGHTRTQDAGLPVEQQAVLPFVARNPQDDLVILYTGGTTGAPKGVRLTEVNIFVTISDMLAVHPLFDADHILSILPLFHVMSLIGNLMAPLYSGAKITYLNDKDPSRIMKAFRQEDITGFLCIPQFYDLLHRRIFEELGRQGWIRRLTMQGLLRIARVLRHRLGWNVGRFLFGPIHARFGPGFRLFGVGGASFAPNVGETLADLGFPLFQAYGMTETTGPVTVTPPKASGGLSCGPAMRHATIRIDVPDPSGIGEIMVQGAHITQGYWKDPDATVDLIRSGWLCTGDLGYLDREGCLHVTGRRKDVIVLSSGKNVFPEVIEAHLEHGSSMLQEVCIVAVPDAGTGNIHLHAVVVPNLERLRRAKVVNIQDRVRYDIENLSRELPPHQRVQSFEVRTDPLPRTTTRKLKRFAVIPTPAGARSGTAEMPTQACGSELLTLIRQVKPNAGPIHLGMNLELDLGFDSLERVELFANIRRRFGLRLSDEDSTQIFRVADLETWIDHRRPVDHGNRLCWRDILQEPLSPAEARLAAAHFWRNPLLEALGFLMCRGFAHAARYCLPLTVVDADRLPSDRPFIICANHASYIDAMVVAGTVPFPVFRRLFFFGASKYAQSPLRRLIWRIFRVVSIDADVNLRDALRLGAEGLRQGLVLCVFPEGHRSIDGMPRDFRKGPAVLAKELDTPIVPVSIAGSHHVWPRSSFRIRLRPVEIRFGRRLAPASAETYDDLTEQVRRAVVEDLESSAA